MKKFTLKEFAAGIMASAALAVAIVSFQSAYASYIGTPATITVTSSTIQVNLPSPMVLPGTLYESFFQNATGTTSSTVIDWSKGNRQSIVLATTTTFSFTGLSSLTSTSSLSLTLWLIQDASGSRTVSWPSGGTGRVQWASSTAPTLSTTAAHMDAISFQCFVPNSTATPSCYGQYGIGNFTQ